MARLFCARIFHALDSAFSETCSQITENVEPEAGCLLVIEGLPQPASERT